MLCLLILSGTLHTAWAEVTWDSGAQGNFSAKITLSSDHVEVTDKLKVTVDLVYSDMYKPSLDSLKLNLLKFRGGVVSPFSLSSETVDPPQEMTPGVLSQRIVFELEPMLLGKHDLTFQEITFHPLQKEQSDVQLMSEIFEVHVSLPPPEATLINLVAPLMPLSKTIPSEIIPQNQQEIDNPAVQAYEIQLTEKSMREKTLPWTGIAFALLTGFIYLIAKSKPHAKPIPVEPAKTVRRAQIEAFAAVKELSQENLTQKKQFPAFYTKLTNIVRKFIEDRYQLRASTYTTQEFLEQVSKHPVLGKKLARN